MRSSRLFALAIPAKVPAAELRDVLFAYPTAASDVEYVVSRGSPRLSCGRATEQTGRAAIPHGVTPGLSGPRLTLPLGSGFTVKTAAEGGSVSGRAWRLGTLETLVMNVNGIHCESCEERIARALRGLGGVAQVSADHTTATVRLVFDPSRTSREAVRSAIERAGYQVTS